VRTCLLLVAAALVSAQSTAVTYTKDLNGNLVAGGETVGAPGVVTDLRQSINGREVPVQQIEQKVLSQSGNTTVTERLIRHYGTNGALVSTDRVVTEETKTGEGESVVHSTTFQTDLSGNSTATERKTVETHKNGAVTTTDTSIEKKDLNGQFSVAEKHNATAEATSDGKRATETLYLRDANGSLVEAQRSSTTEVKAGNQVSTNTAVYEPDVNGRLALKRQEVSKLTTNPDGSSSTEVEIFGRASDGIARSSSSAPGLTEKRIIERQKAPGGAIVETQSVQVPSVNDPGRLDPARKVSETICRGECDKKN
jgi:hypothetical protein